MLLSSSTSHLRLAFLVRFAGVETVLHVSASGISTRGPGVGMGSMGSNGAGNGRGVCGRAGTGSGTTLSVAAALVPGRGMLTLTDLEAGATAMTAWSWQQW
jgi:hypothetical protein